MSEEERKELQPIIVDIDDVMRILNENNTMGECDDSKEKL